MTVVNNGQGGKVEMTYERWTYLDDYNDDLRSIFHIFDGSIGNQCTEWDRYTTWETVWGYGYAKCEAYRLHINKHTDSIGWGVHEFPQHIIKPGGRYVLFIQGKAVSAVTDVIYGFTDPINGQDIQGTFLGLQPGYYQTHETRVNMPVNFNPLATNLLIETGGTYFMRIQFMLMPLYYRVTQRVVTDQVSGDTSTYVYKYDEPAANDAAHSEAIDTYSSWYTQPYREYRGNSVTHVKNPDDLVTTTWFYQNDVLKGKAYQSLTYKEEFYENFDSSTLNTTDFAYSHAGTNQTIYIAEEGALKSENPSSDWNTYLYRTAYSITNGEVAFGQFKLEDGTDSMTYLAAPNGNYIGLKSQASGTGQELLLYSTAGSEGTLLSSTEFKQETWYGFMFFFDSSNGTRVKVWEKANPQVSAEAVLTALNGQSTLQFNQKVYNAMLWLDDYHEGDPYSETETQYTVDVLYDTVAGNAVPDIAQATLVSSVNDLQVTWPRVTESISRTFNGDATWTGIKTVYDYNTADQGGTQYGNLTRTTQYAWESGAWAAYRGTKTQFYPNASANLTAQPARQILLDCSSGSCDFSTESGLLSESLSLYDSASSYSSAPTDGVLTAQRTWVQGSNYAQVSYAYDSLGNLTDQTIYTQYAGAASNPAGGAQTTHTDYDTTYNTYATSVTNPLSQVTSMTYDHALGLPLSVTDANAATTTALYDTFGRMTAVIAPGDSAGSPTLQISYQNYGGTSSPYQVNLVQKVDGSNFIRLSHFYDGLGREVQSQQVNSPVNGTLYNIVTDYDYDDVSNLVRESIPRQITADTTPSLAAQNFTTSVLDHV